MMKLINKILFLGIILIGSIAVADNNSDKFRDYDADYYLNEGKLLFKIRPSYTNTNAKQKKISGLPDSIPSLKATDSLVKNGYGFDTAATYFLSDHIAAELSVGVSYYKTKKSALNDILVSLNNTQIKASKKNDIWMFPALGSLQYHIAPFGAIRPYIGAGIHGTYLYTRSKSFSLNNGSGWLLQGGCDFVARDDTFITLDVRWYSLETKINYKKEFTGLDNNISSKVKWNPISFSIGFGFIF